MSNPNGSAPDEFVEELVALWRRLLDDGATDPATFTPDTNFFVQGGHSLLGMVLLDDVERRTGVALRLADLFKNPTPARLAEQVRAALPVGP